jgi:hypothetical protein
MINAYGLITIKKNIEIFILIDRNGQLITSEIVERVLKKIMPH